MLRVLLIVWIVGEALLLWATIAGTLRLGSLPCGLWLVAGAAGLAGVRYRFRLRPMLLAAAPCMLLWVGLSGVFIEQRARVLAHETKRALSSLLGRERQPSHRNNATRPNVLIVVFDALRADHLPMYGYGRDTAPNLDALAGDATVFERAYAQAPSTKASIASVFTSKYPSQHGAVYNQNALDASLPTLAEVLADAGYRTAAFVENRMIAREFDYDRGFGHWLMDPRRHAKIYGYLKRDLTQRDFDAQIRYWIEDNRAAEFFLYVHYIDPHSPYEAPDGYLGYYGDSRRPHQRDPAVGDQADENVGALIDRYDEEIRYSDDRFASLIATLRREALLDDTVVIFLSDHGEGFGEHGYIHHSTSVYSDLIDIPLLIRYPKVFPAGRSAVPAQHIDIFPTILDLLDIDRSDLSLEGTSLTPGRAPASRPPDDRFVISEHLRSTRGIAQRAVIGRGYKLVHRIEEGTYELFDIERDPADSTDLIATADPRTVARLKTELEAHLQRTQVRVAKSVEISGDTQAALRELGYVD